MESVLSLEPLISASPEKAPVALYIHWPFCKSKCPYCDFNSHVREAIDYNAWKNAYLAELDYFAPVLMGRTLRSVFFGGGTPSLMPPEIAASIIEKLANYNLLSDNIEITLEANPTSVEISKFTAFRQAGINRVSLGIQSLIPEDLRFLGREHSSSEAIAAIELAARCFDRYSFDLIYARPRQTLSAWEKELRHALTLTCDHLSLYQLTLEKGTPFYSAHAKGHFLLPDEENAADFYTLTQALMEDAGMPAYEISNHAKPGEECRHNLVYWHYEDYLGIGPGAHSRLNRHALMMIHHPENWLKSVGSYGHGVQQQEKLTLTETLEELLMMGLRLTEGISYSRAEKTLDVPLLTLLPADKCTLLEKEGLLMFEKEGLRATQKGLPLVNGMLKMLLA